MDSKNQERIAKAYKSYLASVDDDKRIKALHEAYEGWSDAAMPKIGGMSGSQLRRIDLCLKLAYAESTPYNERETAYATMIRIFEGLLNEPSIPTIDQMLAKAAEVLPKRQDAKRDFDATFGFLLNQVRRYYPNATLNWELGFGETGIKMKAGTLIWGEDVLQGVQTLAQDKGLAHAALSQIPRVLRAESFTRNDSGQGYFDGGKVINFCVGMMNSLIPDLANAPIPFPQNFSTAPPPQSVPVGASTQQQAPPKAKRAKKNSAKPAAGTNATPKKGKLWSFYDFILKKLQAGASEVTAEEVTQFCIDRWGNMKWSPTDVQGYSRTLAGFPDLDWDSKAKVFRLAP